MIFPVQPRQKFGTVDLAYWEDFLTEEDIHKIISLPEWNDLKNARVGGQGQENIINKKIRDSKINWIGLREETMDIYQKISNVISEVNNRFFNFNIEGMYENIQLGLYSSDDKGHYDWHVDRSPNEYSNAPRKLSMALLLNDPTEFEGGEFQVKIQSDQIQNLELKKGRAWFFPSWVLHRVAPVHKGIRKSLVVWAGGPAFK